MIGFSQAKAITSYNSVVDWLETSRNRKSGIFVVPADTYYVAVWGTAEAFAAGTGAFYVDSIRVKNISRAFYDVSDPSKPGTVREGTEVEGPANQGRKIARGYQEGTCRHGDVVTFNPVFQNAPRVDIAGGISYEPRSGQWSGAAYDAALPQVPDQSADGLTASGFTMRARLRQPVGTTARSENFPANNLDTLGEAVEKTLVNPPAVEDRYFVHYSVDIDVDAEFGGATSLVIVVAVETFEDIDGQWRERNTKSYSCSAPGGGSNSISLASEVMQAVASGLSTTAPGDKIRIKVKTVTKTGGGFTSFSVVGFTAGGVTYDTNNSAEATASQTPVASIQVRWKAMEVG
jgi:hypothetical protein